MLIFVVAVRSNAKAPQSDPLEASDPLLSICAGKKL